MKLYAETAITDSQKHNIREVSLSVINNSVIPTWSADSSQAASVCACHAYSMHTQPSPFAYTTDLEKLNFFFSLINNFTVRVQISGSPAAVSWPSYTNESNHYWQRPAARLPRFYARLLLLVIIKRRFGTFRDVSGNKPKRGKLREEEWSLYKKTEHF